jgi:hypothetical protein
VAPVEVGARVEAPDDVDDPEDGDESPLTGFGESFEPGEEAPVLPASVPAPSFGPPSPLEPSRETDRDDADEEVALRSFFAQPDPLNTIVGATNPLRTSVE